MTERQLPWLIRGNHPYIVAAVLAIVIVAAMLVARLTVELPAGAPARTDSAAVSGAPQPR
jgi:hypothetical protein